MPRNTIQKQMILDAVHSLRTHPTCEEIYERIRLSYPEISLGTVYRNLNLMARAGQIRRISVPDAADRFDFNTSAHYHIKCMRCAAFSDVEMGYMHSIDELVSQCTGYHLASEQDLVFQGVCPACRAVAEAEASHSA